MRTLLTTAALALLAIAAPPGAARAAAAPGGLRHQRTIYADAADVALRSPEGVACAGRGALVVADTGNGRLLTFRWKDGALEDGRQVRLAQLPYPVRVQIDGKGFVLALDRRTRRIVRVDANGAFAGYVEAQGLPAPMTPAAFALDRHDAVHVLDVLARKVLVLAPDGKVRRQLPLPKGAAGVTDLAVDAAGRIYVVDAVTAAVFAAEPGAAAFTPLSGSLKELISFPATLTADGRGSLYLVDQHGHAVVRIGTDGTFQGRELAMGWKDGAVSYPAQLCLNGEGDLFLADRNNHRVQVFSLPR